MSIIKSKIISSAQPNPETADQLREGLGLPKDQPISLMVLEVNYDRKKYFCCLSGGEMKDGEPHLTLVGHAALEALANYPVPNETLIFQEIKIGETPLKNKVKSTLKNAPSNGKICFFGDMQGELDGVLSDVFNIQKS
ncbi:hypothetical protein [Serratia proteamaculans]